MTKRRCQKCGALILPQTAERTGGVCMPCKNGTRDRIEKFDARMEQSSRKVIAAVLGILLAACCVAAGFGRDWSEPMSLCAAALVYSSVESLVAREASSFGKSLRHMSAALALALFVGLQGPAESLVSCIPAIAPEAAGGLLLVLAVLLYWVFYRALFRMTGLNVPAVNSSLGRLPVGLVAFGVGYALFMFLLGVCMGGIELEVDDFLSFVVVVLLLFLMMCVPAVVAFFVYRSGVRLFVERENQGVEHDAAQDRESADAPSPPVS